jgi:hypothetical protein
MATFSPENIPASADVISSPLRNNFNKLVTLLNAGLGDDQFADDTLSGSKLKTGTVPLTKTTLIQYMNSSVTTKLAVIGGVASRLTTGSGYFSAAVTLPVTMADTNYRITVTQSNYGAADQIARVFTASKSTTGFTIFLVTNESSAYTAIFDYIVIGNAA